MQKLFALLLFIRIGSVFLVQTYFVPDEYWQSLEVAHNFVFGYGHITWEWREGIRSSAYPMIFILVYKLLSFFDADYPSLMVIMPRILQALLSACGDLCTCLLSRRLHGSDASYWTAFCLLSSWFIFYCSSRTLINTAEMAVTAVGFYYYPWTPKISKLSLAGYLWWAGVSCMLRPTAAFTWIPLFLWHLARMKRTFIPRFLVKTTLVGTASIVILLLLDYCLYGKWVFSPGNFFYWNWTLNVGEFYGQHPWHWYLLQGLPAVLSGFILPFLYGLRKRPLWPFYSLVLYFVACLSIVPHKEFRFLLPILPLTNIVCGNVLWSLWRQLKIQWVKRCLVLFLLVSNVPLAVYVSHWHQRGQIQVLGYLGDQALTSPNVSIFFAMPCHSTPFYSHLHSNVPMKFLTCEPKIEDRDSTVEYDVFRDDPVKNMKRFLSDQKPPTHIVMFSNLVPKVHFLFSDFVEKFRTFNSHFGENKEVVVFCRK